MFSDQIGRLDHRVPFVITEDPEAPQYSARSRTGHLAGCLGLCWFPSPSNKGLYVYPQGKVHWSQDTLVVNTNETSPAYVAPLGFFLLWWVQSVCGYPNLSPFAWHLDENTILISTKLLTKTFYPGSLSLWRLPHQTRGTHSYHLTSSKPHWKINSKCDSHVAGWWD